MLETSNILYVLLCVRVNMRYNKILYKNFRCSEFHRNSPLKELSVNTAVMDKKETIFTISTMISIPKTTLCAKRLFIYRLQDGIYFYVVCRVYILYMYKYMFMRFKLQA